MMDVYGGMREGGWRGGSEEERVVRLLEEVRSCDGKSSGRTGREDPDELRRT